MYMESLENFKYTRLPRELTLCYSTSLKGWESYFYSCRKCIKRLIKKISCSQFQLQFNCAKLYGEDQSNCYKILALIAFDPFLIVNSVIKYQVTQFSCIPQNAVSLMHKWKQYRISSNWLHRKLIGSR